MKDFANGWLQSHVYSLAQDHYLDVNFVLAQNGFFVGKLPEIKEKVKRERKTLDQYL